MISPNFETDPPLVLIVDDEKTVRLLLHRVVEKEGYRILEAVDGKQCLNLCQQLKPDLVLLDALMPQMDGFSCCAQLSALLGDESPTVLMITGLNDKQSVDQAFEVGAADYITKPIDWPVLCQRMRRLLHTRWAMKELRQRVRVQEDLAQQLTKQTEELGSANAALQIEIKERKQAEEKIKASLKEKEVLLKEIHHRVKNNLQIISSLLKLQSRSIQDRKTLDIFNESQNRIRTMALIHESLYQSNDLSKINFAEYIQQLVANLFRSYGSSLTIKSVIIIENFFLGIDAVIPCGLIVNELVSNSLKYAFPHGEKGEVRIEIYSKTPGNFIILISDNGVGLPEGIDLYNTKTLGLQLVSNLVEQLAGIMEFHGEHGTKFKIQFSTN